MRRDQTPERPEDSSAGAEIIPLRRPVPPERRPPAPDEQADPDPDGPTAA